MEVVKCMITRNGQAISYVSEVVAVLIALIPSQVSYTLKKIGNRIIVCYVAPRWAPNLQPNCQRFDFAIQYVSL